MANIYDANLKRTSDIFDGNINVCPISDRFRDICNQNVVKLYLEFKNEPGSNLNIANVKALK